MRTEPCPNCLKRPSAHQSIGVLKLIRDSVWERPLENKLFSENYGVLCVPPIHILTCVVQLKMSVNRLRLMQQKQSALAKQARRELAKLLDEGKEESAKIRVENIIREDLFVEMLEILELYCELLLARFGLLEQMYRHHLS